jgi:hypothetical protein
MIPNTCLSRSRTSHPVEDEKLAISTDRCANQWAGRLVLVVCLGFAGMWMVDVGGVAYALLLEGHAIYILFLY